MRTFEGKMRLDAAKEADRISAAFVQFQELVRGREGDSRIRDEIKDITSATGNLRHIGIIYDIHNLDFDHHETKGIRDITRNSKETVFFIEMPDNKRTREFLSGLQERSGEEVFTMVKGQINPRFAPACAGKLLFLKELIVSEGARIKVVPTMSDVSGKEYLRCGTVSRAMNRMLVKVEAPRFGWLNHADMLAKSLAESYLNSIYAENRENISLDSMIDELGENGLVTAVIFDVGASHASVVETIARGLLQPLNPGLNVIRLSEHQRARLGIVLFAERRMFEKIEGRHPGMKEEIKDLALELRIDEVSEYFARLVKEDGMARWLALFSVAQRKAMELSEHDFKADVGVIAKGRSDLDHMLVQKRREMKEISMADAKRGVRRILKARYGIEKGILRNGIGGADPYLELMEAIRDCL